MKLLNAWQRTKRLGPVQWWTRVQWWRMRIPILTKRDDADWNSDDVSVDSHVDVRVTLQPDFDAIRKQCGVASLELPLNGNVMFGFTMQNVGAVAERDAAYT